MINIITGRPGSGKTYILTRIALDHLKAGRDVYSNYFIKWEGNNLHYWDNHSELVGIRSGVIIMDEAQVYFNSRKWEALDERLQYKLQQHRKDGLDIWGTVQHESRLDVVMRELVGRFYRCEKVLGSKEDVAKPWGFIKMAEYLPEDMKKDRKEAIDLRWFAIKKEFCEAYDTLAKIENKQPEGNIITIQFKVCPHCGSKKPIGR